MPRQPDQPGGTGRRPPLVDARSQHPNDGVTDDLLVAAGHGDLDAFAAFYDRTVSVVFGFLRGVLGETTAARQATEQVYLHMWQTAPHFNTTNGCAYAQLLFTARRELVGRLHDIRTQREAERPSGQASPIRRDQR